MRRALGIIGIMFLLGGLSGCEFPFDVEFTEEAKIYLQCIPDGDRITVTPRYAAPIGKDTPKGTVFEVTLRHNGALLDTEAFENEDGTVSYVHHFESAVPVAGDEISVRIKADGLPEAGGSTLIPPAPGIRDVSWELTEQDNGWGWKTPMRKVTVTLSEEPGEDDYYAIRILNTRTVMYEDGSTDESQSWVIPGYILSETETLAMDLGDYVQVNYDGAVLGGSGYQPLTFLSCKHFEGKTYTFYLNSQDEMLLDEIRDVMPDEDSGIYESGIEIGQEWDGGDDEDEDPDILWINNSYTFYLYRLSPEFYYYGTALFRSNFDFLSNMGLTPANFSYSNVHGGLGLVGAANCEIFEKEFTVYPPEGITSISVPE